MKNISRLFLLTTLMLVLLTAACAAEDGSSPTTTVGTVIPEDIDLTVTALANPAGTATAGTVTGLETATSGLETATAVTDPGTPTAAATQGIVTQASATGVTRTPGIPVTGQDVMLVECQFCVDTRAHALIVLPDTATFEIISPVPETTASTGTDDPRCSTVEVNNGRQVVLCSGPETTPLVVNICTDANTCTDFPIDLLDCPLAEGGSVSPAQTQVAPGTGSTPGNTLIAPTANPGVVISTATPSGPTVTTTP